MSNSTPDHPTVEQLGDRFRGLIERQLETVFRLLLSGRCVSADSRYVRLILNEPHPFANFATVSDPANVRDASAAIEPLLGLNLPVAAIFSGPASAEVEAMLAKNGFVLAEPMPAMGLDIDTLAVTTLPAGYSFVETPSIADDAAWCEAFTEGYGVPRSVSDMFGPAAASASPQSQEFRYYAIKRDGVVVCTSVAYVGEGVVGIYCVSTRPAHRQKGLGAFATAEPLRLARSEGYRTGLLQSSLMGAPVYRRLGFKDYGVVPLYVRMPVGMALSH